MFQEFLVVDGAVHTPQDFRTAFGKDRKEAFVGLHEDGKRVRRFEFAVGDTSKSDIPDLLKVGLITELDAAYRPASQIQGLTALATILQTPQESQDLPAVFGGNEDLREWVGPRVSNRLQSQKVTAVTQTWELTYDFERKAVEDDKSGLLMLRLRDFGNRISGALLRRVVQKYIDMATKTHWLDGQFVVDTDHTYSVAPLGGYATNQSNKNTNPPTAPQLTDGVQVMLGFLDYNGNDIDDNFPNAILIGPKYWAATEEVFKSPVFFHSTHPTTGGDVGARGTGTNVMQDLVRPENRVYHPKLAGTFDDYAFLIKNTPVAPVIMVERSDVPDEFVIRTNPETSDEAYREDRYSVGFRRRDTLVYGPWHHVLGFIS